MPFGRRIRIEYENASDDIASALLPSRRVARSAAPTTSACCTPCSPARTRRRTERDLVILDGLRGPGRFLGMTGGVRPFDRHWWGEGEVKVYFDGESEPTICGTGTEDYLGSAWGLAEFAAPESGAPLVAGPVATRAAVGRSCPSTGGTSPTRSCSASRSRSRCSRSARPSSGRGEEQALALFREGLTTAGDGWIEGNFGAFTLYERSDDWCATGFAYCRDPQPVAAGRCRGRDRGSRRHPRRSPSDAAVDRRVPLTPDASPVLGRDPRLSQEPGRLRQAHGHARRGRPGAGRRARRRRSRRRQHVRVHRRGAAGVDRRRSSGWPTRARTARGWWSRAAWPNDPAPSSRQRSAGGRCGRRVRRRGAGDARPQARPRRRWTCCTFPGRRPPRRGRTSRSPRVAIEPAASAPSRASAASSARGRSTTSSPRSMRSTRARSCSSRRTSRATGRDQGRGERAIVPLIEAVAPRVDRVRLLYLYPSDLTDRLEDAICATGVPYFDLSLQHVSAPLLRRMRRWGDGDRFLRRIERIRRHEPAAAFRSNFIVGYPGRDRRRPRRAARLRRRGAARLVRVLRLLRGGRDVRRRSSTARSTGGLDRRAPGRAARASRGDHVGADVTNSSVRESKSSWTSRGWDGAIARRRRSTA